VARVSNRYATALFELSMERGLLSEYLEQAVFLREALQDPDCQRVITHPKITMDEKRGFFDKAFAGNIYPDLMGFLCLTVAKNREQFIVPTLAAFIEMGRDHFRKTTAFVVSAVPLREDQVSVIAAKLSRKLDKQVDVSVKVDPSIIGGLYIQADGYFIDCTIKNRLHDIKVNLRNG